MQTAQSSESFCFTTGLRGFHVYSTTKGWKPYLQEKITLKREHDNVHDRFAVSGLTTLRGRLAPVVVGHIPRELSRYVWYALEKAQETHTLCVFDQLPVVSWRRAKYKQMYGLKSTLTVSR